MITVNIGLKRFRDISNNNYDVEGIFSNWYLVIIVFYQLKFSRKNPSLNLDLFDKNSVHIANTKFLTYAYVDDREM